VTFATTYPTYNSSTLSRLLAYASVRTYAYKLQRKKQDVWEQGPPEIFVVLSTSLAYFANEIYVFVARQEKGKKVKSGEREE